MWLSLHLNIKEIMNLMVFRYLILICPHFHNCISPFETLLSGTEARLFLLFNECQDLGKVSWISVVLPLLWCRNHITSNYDRDSQDKKQSESTYYCEIICLHSCKNYNMCSGIQIFQTLLITRTKSRSLFLAEQCGFITDFATYPFF